MSDTTLSVINIQVIPPNEGDEHVTLAFVTGMPLPIGDPQTGQPLLAATGVYKVPISKQAALEVAQGLLDEAEKLPEPKRASNIVVPGSMDDVDQVAKNLGQFRN